jgi:hypothetical protein
MFDSLPYTTGMTRSPRWLRGEGLNVPPPDYEGAANTLSGELARDDELPDAVPGHAEQFGGGARADQIAPHGHPARAR